MRLGDFLGDRYPSIVMNTNFCVPDDGMWVMSFLQRAISLWASGVGVQSLYSMGAKQGGASSEDVFEVFCGAIGEFERNPFRLIWVS